MSGAEIETIGLKMIYRAEANPVRAVDGIDLIVPAGQFLLVRGRSGSGKTTLLHLLGALQRPTAGHVRIGAVEVNALTPRRADLFRRRNIGLVFQFFNLVPSLTVEMNVALPLLLEGQRLHHVRDRVDPLLETLGIADRREHAPHELSGGEMQRVAIARALIIQPRAILADEPTGNLDSRTADEVWMMLREETEKRGVTTVVMTHAIDATSYADRVIEMNDGRIEHDSGPAVSENSRITHD